MPLTLLPLPLSPIEVKDLKVSFYKRRREGQAVRDVNFTLEEGQTLGIWYKPHYAHAADTLAAAAFADDAQRLPFLQGEVHVTDGLPLRRRL